MSFFKSLAGPGYVILNVVRGGNIIALLAIVVACAVMLAKMSLATNFFIFDAITHVIISGISLFLIVTELNVFHDFFNRYWPLLAQDSGLTTLGFTMVILGMMLLGHLNNDAMSADSVGISFWRIVLAAGIVAIVFGVINIALTYIFREADIGVTARHVRAHGAVAANGIMPRKSSQKSFQLGGNKETLPTYHQRSPSATSSPRSGPGSTRSGPRFPVRISSPITQQQEPYPKSPTTPNSNITMPNLAHHPAMYSNRV